MYHEVPGHDVAESSCSKFPEETDENIDHPHVLTVWKQQFADALSVIMKLSFFNVIVIFSFTCNNTDSDCLWIPFLYSAVNIKTWGSLNVIITLVSLKTKLKYYWSCMCGITLILVSWTNVTNVHFMIDCRITTMVGLIVKDASSKPWCLPWV